MEGSFLLRTNRVRICNQDLHSRTYKIAYLALVDDTIGRNVFFDKIQTHKRMPTSFHDVIIELFIISNYK